MTTLKKVKVKAADDVSHKPGGRLPLLSTRPTGLLPVSLLGAQRHTWYEQFA